MSALKDPKLETFAQALLLAIARGLPRSKAADEAAKVAGYDGSSRASNARKRAQRRDVKARLVELAAPQQAKVETAIALDVAGAKLRLAEIIRADSDLSGVKAPDIIAAIRQLSIMEGWDAPKRHEHTGADGAPLFDVEKLTDDQLAALEAIIAQAGGVALDGDDPLGADLSPPEGELH